jgi:capsid assembly protease
MFAHLAASVFNRPLLIRLQKAELIVAALAQRLGVVSLRLPDGRMRAFDGADAPAEIMPGGWAEPDRGYQVVAGVAVIDVFGTLVQRQMGLRPVSGMTGYNAVRANLFAALDDPAVRAVALDIDSPGGDVAGLFDLTDAIYAARGSKPIRAILDESAASAAYAIAAACDRVTVPRTGYAGSVGVIVLHVDLSQLLAAEGVTVTVLQYGARKAYGQPAIPLSDPARATLQADVDRVGELFVATIARYRRIAPQRVRAQEAAVFRGRAGVDAGLADQVASPAEAFAQLARMVGKPASPLRSAPPRPARPPAAHGRANAPAARRRTARLFGLAE